MDQLAMMAAMDASDVALDQGAELAGGPDLAPDAGQSPDVAQSADVAQSPDAAQSSTPVFLGADSINVLTRMGTFVHDAGREANRYLLVGVATETAAVRVLAATYGGQPLARLAEHRAGACGVVLFGLSSAPPAGPNTVRIDLDATSNLVAIAGSFAGVRQTIGQGDRWTTNGTRSPIELTAPSAPGELVVDMICLNHTTLLLAPASGQTVGALRQLGRVAGGMSIRPGTPSTGMIWSFGGGPATGWTSIAASLKPVF